GKGRWTSAAPPRPPPAPATKHGLDQRHAPRASTAHAPTSDVMMMSLTQPHRQALGAIADGLAGSDPRLASMLTIFSRLAAGEEMPAREKTRARRRRPAAHRPRRARPPPPPRPRAPAPGHSLPPTAPPVPAPEPATGHTVAVGGHLRRSARRRAGPQHQRPQDLHPADGNGVPLSLHPTACRWVPVDE